MKKILLGLLLVLSTVVLADGYGFSVEENLGYYDGESIYDEFGNNKYTGQTREYELSEKEKRDSQEYWAKRRSGEISDDVTFKEYIYLRDHNMEIEHQEEDLSYLNEPEYAQFKKVLIEAGKIKEVNDKIIRVNE
ncbi:hypothetical protein KST26_04145 [Fusobacterium animalis]|uniref:hypothetical protein n=1 Tax=Fusobacterium animalis TaxID=76859 RepID=UPI0030CD5BA2